ncbi:hypothetical protein [Streptomyces sp. LS1784]|uniref:hypothetical protein n=1 Tax=Streptomyces sp. LS1784 TaxID=2851533 RepID=UPI001CC955E0|nr:hypothetical protein [Streptomyces sp. LS1784]
MDGDPATDDPEITARASPAPPDRRGGGARLTALPSTHDAALATERRSAAAQELNLVT